MERSAMAPILRSGFLRPLSRHCLLLRSSQIRAQRFSVHGFRSERASQSSHNRSPISRFQRLSYSSIRMSHSSLRTFATLGSRRQAVVNPRNDEDGNPMEVEITPRAANVSSSLNIQSLPKFGGKLTLVPFKHSD